jgi:hypothetical protein
MRQSHCPCTSTNKLRGVRTRKFITVFIRTPHQYLCWANCIHSTLPSIAGTMCWQSWCIFGFLLRMVGTLPTETLPLQPFLPYENYQSAQLLANLTSLFYDVTGNLLIHNHLWTYDATQTLCTMILYVHHTSPKHLQKSCHRFYKSLTKFQVILLLEVTHLTTLKPSMHGSHLQDQWWVNNFAVYGGWMNCVLEQPQAQLTQCQCISFYSTSVWNYHVLITNISYKQHYLHIRLEAFKVD